MPGLRGRLLLPVLPAPLETLIARGDVRVEPSGDGLVLRVGDVTLPMAAGSVDPGAAAAVNDDPAALAAALARQHYVLASWRDGRRHLNYRRFFDIDRLVALRAEDERVFADTHAAVIGWVAAGELDALRVDHPDGLADPEEYCRRLRAAAPGAWIVVEKILAPDESLPRTWPVAGTTGYDFLARVDGLFVDPEGEAPLTRCWADFTGASADHAAFVRAAKRAVLQGGLASDVARLARLLAAMARTELASEAFAPATCTDAIVALAASFDAYRTYIRRADGHLTPEDERRVAGAFAAARAAGEADPRLLALLREVLLLRVSGADAAELGTRLQQLTAVVMAKAVEDTVYYRFNRLLALNEVGGSPERFATPPEEFHAACLATWQRAPHTLLATSTHDTKRSEDVRARLVLLSEMPEAWAAAVRRWSALNARHRAGERFDRNAEYHLYQTLVGAWPIGVERVTTYMEKAVLHRSPRPRARPRRARRPAPGVRGVRLGPRPGAGPAGFRASRLDSEPSREPHAALLDWHRRLIRLRRRLPSLRDGRLDRVRACFDEAERWLVVERLGLTVACNLAAQERTLTLSAPQRMLLASEAAVRLQDRALTLPPDSVAVVLTGDPPG